MLELFKAFLNPDEMNEPVAAWLRWPLAALLSIGFAFCLVLSADTLRHWSERPHPATWIVFLTLVEFGAVFLAVKLIRGERIVAPVLVPPRPMVVRVLGLLTALTCGPIAFVSGNWFARIEFGLMATSGLALLVAPTLFFPHSKHGA
jgi:hypothetical protein